MSFWTTRLQLVAEDFDQLLVNDGILAEYRPAVPCPCAAGVVKTPRVDCACGGWGYLYPLGLRRPGLSVLLTGRSRSTAQKGAGPIGVPSVQATFPTTITPSVGDQLWPVGEVTEVEQLISFEPRRPETERVSLRAATSYGAQPAAVSTRRPGLLLYPEITTLKVALALINGEPCVLDGADYELHPEGNTTRVEPVSRRLREAGAMSVRYEAPACYMVLRRLPTRRAGPVSPVLPSKVELVGLDRWGQEGDGR